MILHLLEDEKFTDPLIKRFEDAAPGRNVYLVGRLDRATGFKHIRQAERVLAAPAGSAAYRACIGPWSRYSGVLLHNLSYYKLALLDEIPPPVRVCGLIWGFEIYDLLPGLLEGGLGPLSAPYAALLRDTPAQALLRRIVHLVPRIAALKPSLANSHAGEADYLRHLQAAFRRMDYVGTVLPGEADLLAGIGLPCNPVRYSYGVTESAIRSPALDTFCDGDNILLGNSCTLTNNHLEMLHLLSKMDLGERKVVAPLNYGRRRERYGPIVLREGRRLLGARFSPLLDFLPVDDYLRIVKSCGIVVMNHYRQQALGNTLAALWLGCRVYLSERTPTYGFLRGLGIRIGSIEAELSPSNPAALAPLPREEALRNRSLLNAEYGPDVSARRTRRLVDLLGEAPPSAST